jgi:hypothetical protein
MKQNVWPPNPQSAPTVHEDSKVKTAIAHVCDSHVTMQEKVSVQELE